MKDPDLSTAVGVTQSVAAGFYVQEGVIVKVIKADGQQVDFVPSDEDIEMREKTLRTQALLKWQAQSMHTASIFQIIILVLGVLVGLSWFRLSSVNTSRPQKTRD